MTLSPFKNIIFLQSFLSQAAFCLFLNSMSLFLLKGNFSFQEILIQGVSFVLAAGIVSSLVSVFIRWFLSCEQAISIGTFLSFLAMLLLTLRGQRDLHVVFSLYAVGYGFYISNLLVVLNRQYSSANERHRVQQVNYFMVNLGSIVGFLIFLGVLVFSQRLNFYFLHGIAACFLLIMFLFFSLRKSHLKNLTSRFCSLKILGDLLLVLIAFGLVYGVSDSVYSSMSTAILFVGLAILWLFYQYRKRADAAYLSVIYLLVFGGTGFWFSVSMFHFFDPLYVTVDVHQGFLTPVLMVLNPVSIVLFTLIFKRKSFRPKARLVIGSLFNVLAYSGLFVSLIFYYSAGLSLFFLSLNIIFVGVSEFLLAPTLYALVGSWVSHRHDAIIMALLRLVRASVFVLLYAISDKVLVSAHVGHSLSVSSLLLLIFSLISLLMLSMLDCSSRRISRVQWKL